MMLIILLSMGGILFFFGLFCRSSNKSNKNPFKENIGIPLTLNNDYMLCENLSLKDKNKRYSILFTDHLPNQYTKVELLKKGTIIKLSKAIQSKTSLSGVVESYVLGTVYSESLNKEVIFFKSWGGLYNDFSSGKRQTYWSFEKAIWQDKVDTTKYYPKRGVLL
ncbi:hypothetical protein [Pedobacter cryotolerans]|uniref:Uncharacterized protein n=1 Tax=Pedobacter cryotolerans TaxID=2571270 RepID=A0A4V5NX49_9SPHI|nr:hypothetical protein [Pedobacter cryotolerans]TKB97422.1 hypothetical protein FA045_15785 [Pedobacter cryotolerans]